MNSNPWRCYWGHEIPCVLIYAQVSVKTKLSTRLFWQLYSKTPCMTFLKFYTVWKWTWMASRWPPQTPETMLMLTVEEKVKTQRKRWRCGTVDAQNRCGSCTVVWSFYCQLFSRDNMQPVCGGAQAQLERCPTTTLNFVSNKSLFLLMLSEDAMPPEGDKFSFF